MISFVNDPNELNTVIRLWPDGPPSSLPDVGPEITFGSPAVFGPETVLWGSASRPFQRSDGIRMLICSSAIVNGRLAARSDQDRALQVPYPSTFHLGGRQASRSISVF